ncbi:MAG: diaminopimelate decarboxylase [Theionarchaea archaeon]|nr:diaminopimelate decarboxylase [Theionarchaea archaeon]
MKHEVLTQIAEKYGTPVYVYDKSVIVNQYRRLDASVEFSPKKIYYASKANSNIAILNVFRDLGCSIDVVSPGELFLALKAGFNPSQILFTGNNLAVSEMEYAVEHNVLMTVDSLSQMETYGKINPGSSVCVRINPNLGAGHHRHVITGGLQSKFGIYYTEINRIRREAEKHNLKIIGIHMHIGSGILEYRLLLKGISSLLDVAAHFAEVEFIDIGGGLGIPYRSEESPLNLEEFGRELTSLVRKWVRMNKEITLVLEPGRFLVAESGVLLTRVTAVKHNPKYTFVGVDTGFNHFMRPAVYDAYHEIQLINNDSRKREIVTVCGNICESGDIFAKKRDLPHLGEGDLLAIENVGAYGFSMASQYNARALPAEVLVDNGNIILIRKRGTFKDFLLNQVYEVDTHE